MKKFFAAGLFVFMTAIFSTACAEVVTIEVSATCIMGRNDSQAAVEEMAYQEALRAAADKAGVYVESLSEMENLELTKDIVRTISAKVLKDVEKKFKYDTVNGQAFKITCFVTAKVDTSNIELKALLEDRKSLDRSKVLEQQVEELQREIERLKNSGTTDIAELEKNFLIKAYEKNLDATKSKEISKHYIGEIRKLDPLNVEAQLAVYNRFDSQYAFNDAQNILKIDPNNLPALVTLALTDKNEDNQKSCARRALKLVRSRHTPDELKKITLNVMVDYRMIWDITAEEEFIQLLYERSFGVFVTAISGKIDKDGTWHKLSPTEIKDFLVKLKRELNLSDDLSIKISDMIHKIETSKGIQEIVATYSYSEDEI